MTATDGTAERDVEPEPEELATPPPSRSDRTLPVGLPAGHGRCLARRQVASSAEIATPVSAPRVRVWTMASFSGSDVEVTIAAGRLQLIHWDPFDRMLVAQARSHGLTLVTRDKALGDHQVPVLPA
jgi:hypothetical protein